MEQLNRLTLSEEYVMKAIWACKKEPGLQDIFQRVNHMHEREWAIQTVSTFLSKLCQKEYIQLQRKGKTFTYKILVTERDYQKSQLERMLTFIYNGDAILMKEDLQVIK